MSGKYLDSNFSLPCPPGLDIPPEIISPFTSNNLKVNFTRAKTNTKHVYPVCLVLYQRLRGGPVSFFSPSSQRNSETLILSYIPHREGLEFYTFSEVGGNDDFLIKQMFSDHFRTAVSEIYMIFIHFNPSICYGHIAVLSLALQSTLHLRHA